MSPIYSIVIPVYNESKRIPKNIDEIFRFFATVDEPWEVIFVNDGSKDDTAMVLEQYQKNYTFRVVSYEQNRGKGYAVRQGVSAANGEWIIFFDIDLATPLTAFNQFRSTKTEQDQVVIGSRRVKGSEIKKSESGLRVFLGQGFTKLSNILVPKITDFTCGFKCYKKEAAQKIFSVALIDRWGFDTELLYIAHIKKIPVRQMAVQWSHDDDSRVKVFKAVVQSFQELCRMAWNRACGRYR